MSITKFQMKDLLEQVALNEAKKKKAAEEDDDDEENMDEEVVLEKAEEEDDEDESGKKNPFAKKSKKSEEDDEEDDEEEDDEDGKKKSMKEETIAAASLKGGSRSGGADPKSKVEYLSAIIGHLASAKKEDLVKWFDQTQSLYHAGKDWGVGDKSGSNQSSVDMKGGSGPKTRMSMPKLGVREDVEEMFAGQDLSEEFKENVATLFEAAVHARAVVEIARIEEEYEEKLVESVAEIQEELSSKVDSYLEYVVESWMEENEVAIESTLRNELMEEFIDGLQGLFAEHYIAVPQDKVDVLEALAQKVEALEGKLDEAINENAELKTIVSEVEKNEVFESLCDGLAFSQVEKFKALAEGIDFDGDVETYGKKLAFVKENYFKTKSSVTASNIEEETFEGEESFNTVSIDPTVNRYVQAISKTVKK
jgi:hypothetical protein